MPHDLNLDLEMAVSSLDGTNACQFFSASFAALLLRNGFSLLESDTEKHKLKETIDSLLVAIPQKINSYRDVSKEMFLEDALEILIHTGIVDRSFEIKELFSCQDNIKTEQGKIHLENAIHKLIKTSTSTAAAVYTCPPISFTICSMKTEQKSLLVLIDFHRIPYSVGGKNTAIITMVYYKSDKSISAAIKKVSEWVQARIISSSKKGGHQSLLLMEPKKSKQIIADSIDGILDVTDEELLLFDEETTTDVNLEKDDTENLSIVADNTIGEFDTTGSDDKKLVNVSIEIEERQQNKQRKTPENSQPRCISLEETDNKTSSANNDNHLPEVKEEDLLFWKGHMTKFGYTTFKEYQKKAINSVQLGRDIVVIQPTGSGTSLCASSCPHFLIKTNLLWSLALLFL